nr:WD repeat-containing protein 60 [Onthophagus taurus]
MSTKKQNVKKESKPTKTKTNPSKTREDPNLTKKKEKEEKVSVNKASFRDGGKLGKSSISGVSSPRVSKSQFFPNKGQMYKNALKVSEDQGKFSIAEKLKDRERNKTRTLSPSDVKVLKPKQDVASTSNVKRPGTATIRKHEIEEDNVLKIQKDQKYQKEENYESDFDSYESDFEEYLSSLSSTTSISSDDSNEKESNSTKPFIKENNLGEEEKKLDSGNYEISETKHKQVLTNIKESNEIENNKNNLINKPLTKFINNAILSNPASLSSSDEGFEEIKNEKIHFVNFLEAKRKNSLIKSAELKKRRGQDLLGMIHLDIQNFTIFELQPIRYDDFMKSFGNRNYLQISTQTGDDNVDEEVLTDSVEFRTIWTQNPIQLKKENFGDYKLYHQDYLGFGFDDIDENKRKDISSFNENNLKEFLGNASEVILNLLEEKSQLNNCKEIENNQLSLPFSDGHITFNTELDFLKNTDVILATFSENITKMLTVHVSIEEERSLLCLWKISQQNQPEKIFSIYGTINSLSMDDNYIFAGLNDGTISIWSLTNNADFYIKADYITPIYISDIEKAHHSKIIAINPIEIENSEGYINKQIYTLDEDGLLKIWSMIKLNNSNYTLSLHINSTIDFKDLYKNLNNLQCTDMCVNKLDPNQIFVSTNYGNILHFITTGKKTHPKFYTDNNNDRIASNCLINCPFSPLYFLCGYQNGNVKLYSRETEKPLMTMSNKDQESSIDLIQWSINKPCVFYTKDSKNVVHIWDLTKSDIFPICSLKFNDRIDYIKLSPNISQNNTIKRSYLVIITRNKFVDLYVLNKEHGQQNKQDYDDNVRKFTNYVNRL